MAAPDELVALAVLGAPHGVRGGLRARPYNPDSELIYELESVFLRGPSGTESRKVLHIQPHGPGLLLSLQGVDSRAQAEALSGVELCVPRSMLPALDPGEHYFVDMIGLDAVDTQGNPLGPVVDVHQYPASQVLCVDMAAGRYEIPLCEPYVLRVDPEQGRVTVDGLEDLEPVPTPTKKRRRRAR